MNWAELLIDENIDQVLALDTKFNVIVWNKACEIITGIKKSEISGRNIFDFFPEMKTNAADAGALRTALAGYKSFVPCDRALRTEYVEKHFIPLKDEQGTVIGILIIKHDVAHRVKAEQELNALNKSLEDFKRIIDSAHDIVITFDVNGNITYWNAAAEKLLGYPTNEILGKSIACLLPDDKRELPAKILNDLRSDRSVDLVTRQRTRTGKEIDVAANIFPMVDEHNTFIGGCKIARDITEILRYQKNIETLNNELTIKNRQLASLNSELKTFTNIAINNYGETLRQLYLHFEYIVANDARNLSDTGKGNIRKAQAAIQKMKLLTSDITAFMRLNELDTEMRVIDLNAVMKTVVSDLRENIDASKIKLTIDTLPEIKGYPFLVSLIFHHLLENAIKFRNDKEQPVITVTSEHNVKGSLIKHEMAQPNTFYDIITIQDNGIGFPEEQKEDVFHIFTRLHPGKYKGSGIGLAICRKAIELHNGFIITESTTGQGSLFRCYFPIADAPLPYPEA